MDAFLFREFCNNLYLGQWELARACAITLIKNDGFSDEKGKLISTLKSLAKNPSLSRSSWPHFPCPSHVSFLSCCLLKEFFSSWCDLEDCKKNAEFNIMVETFLKVPEHISQELSYIFSLASESGKCLPGTPCQKIEFSEECISALKGAILQDPLSSFLIIFKICSPLENTDGYKVNSQIRTIFFQSISDMLQSLNQNLNKSVHSKAIESSSHSKVIDINNIENIVSKLFLMLSVFPECLLYKNRDNAMDEIFLTLLTLCKLNVLSTEDVYRALLCRSSPYLLQEFCDKENEFKVHKEIGSSDTVKCAQIINELGEFLPREALFSCLKSNTHFLENFIDSSVEKILSGRCNDVWCVLEGTVFNRLQPLLLLISWTLCTDNASTTNVIQAVKSWSELPDYDPTLVKACKKFQFNLDVAQQFINYYWKFYPQASELELQNKNKSILMQLQTQSPLQVINKIFGLRNMSPEQILQLLNISKEFDQREDVPSHSNIADLTVFSGYLAIQMLLEAIYFSCEFRHLMTKERLCLLDVLYDTTELFQKSEPNNIEENSDVPNSGIGHRHSLSEYFARHGPQATYSKFIVERIEKSKCEIKKIFPIEFRVEILENIFSMLFLTPNELNNSFESHTDSDQGYEGEEKPDISSMSLSPKSFDSNSVFHTLTAMRKEALQGEDKKVVELNKRFSGRFVISTIKLKDSEEAKDFSEVCSGHNSSKSTESNSSISFQPNSFLCNELITRDLLLLLKDALTEAEAELFRKKSEAKSSTVKKYEEATPNLKSSISNSELVEHTSQLLRFVSEANWRYEVVKSDIFQEQNDSKYGAKLSAFQRQCSMSSSDGNDKEPKKRRRKKHHKHGLHRSISVNKDSFSESNIIQCMLSSPESLLRHSLWSKNLLKVEQVIESFNLQETSEAKEVSLTKSLQEISRKLSLYEKVKVKSPKKETMPPTYEKRSNLDDILAISEAASTALKTTEISLVIDQNLSILKLPCVEEDFSTSVDYSEVVLGRENIHSVIIADLAYSSNLSFELSHSLFDMAIKRWKKFKITTKKSSSLKMKCCTFISMRNIVKEFQELSTNDENSTTLKSLFWPLNENSNYFPESLSCFLGSLDSNRFKTQVSDWRKASICMDEFSRLLLNEDAVETDTSYERDLVSGNKLHESYKQLLKSLQNIRFWVSDSIQGNQERYLKKLMVHLHQVTAAILECKRQSISTGSITYTSYFSILRESPSELLKKNIFQGGVRPEKIEKIAESMKVNLVHVLTRSTLPHVPLLHKNNSIIMTRKEPNENTCSDYHQLVLNDSSCDWPAPRHPDWVARNLMRDLLAIIQDTAMANDTSGVFSIESLISLSKHSELPNWIEECSELAHVDLDLLKTREEKLAFYVNVTNLAWLHALLYEVMHIDSKEENINNLSSDFPNEESKKNYAPIYMLSPFLSVRFAIQKIFGYSIGKIGFISLFDLRYQILHGHFPTPRHLEYPPFNKFISIGKPTWEKYMPPPESRLLFVLCDGLLCSPKLQVMFSENIDDVLEESMKDFFDHTIHVDVKSEIVTLPMLLKWYALDFSKDDDHDLTKAPFEGLINFISGLVRPPLSESFQIFFSEDAYLSCSENIDTSGRKQLPFHLQFKPPLLQFGIMLEYIDICDTVVSSNTNEPFLDLQESSVMNYLKEKCSILIDLHQFTSSDISSIQSIQKSLVNVPIFNHLAYYKNMQLHMDAIDKYQWFASALSPAPEEIFSFKQIEFGLNNKNWQKTLFHIDLYIEHYGNKSVHFALLKQIVLEHLASLQPDEDKDFADPWSYALHIEDSTSRANTVLQNINKWPDNIAVQTLKYCLSDPKTIVMSELHQCLKTKLREITVYKKISTASQIYGAEAKDSVYVFSTWQEVADCSIWDQYRILEFIKSCGKYEYLVEWVELHTIDSKHKMTGLSMELIWLLNQAPSKEADAIQILDSLTEATECLAVCELVLPELFSLEGKLHIIQHIVTLDLELDKQSYYFNMLLGLKMLLALKSHTRENYADLVAHPYLLLEEMLMNVEIKEAEKVLLAITDDLKMKNYISMSLCSVNQLVEDYASKALEVHFLDALLESSSSSTLVLSVEETLVSDEPFVIPVNVPKKEEWVPDAKIQTCEVCKEEHFNMFSRRHHCRRCGRVVCANCSQHALIVEGYGNIKVRVCDDCYNIMTGSLSLNTASFEKRFRILSSMKSSSPRNSPLQQENVFRRRASSIHGVQTLRWTLSSDIEQNASVRNEFSYDHAPSISLCFSILKLHNDPNRCAQFMLNLCDRLLGKIKPRQSGKLAPEVDYNLMISIIKSLLVNAKVKCYQVHNTEALSLVDLYFQHLDAIKLLVNANCRHLVPREALTNSETARKLRDRLLEEERMNLALEVSTKFNLEKNGVWSTWGLFCLKAGDWQTAREKFQQCLKKPKDKNNHKQQSPLLQKVLSCLEKSKSPGTDKTSVVYKSLAALKNIQSGSTQFNKETGALDTKIKDECIYYLHTYGSHFSMVAFFQRQCLIREALDYILDQRCEMEVFIEALFMPALKYSQFSTLKYLIANSDPPFHKWWPYLFSTCRHLERLKYHNVLYEMQLFMEDYIRAAKSCINFFLAPTTSYKNLFDRQNHLHNAKKHFEKCLKNLQEQDKYPVGRKNKNVLSLPQKEIESYIQTISLQLEVTEFFKLFDSPSASSLFYMPTSLSIDPSKGTYSPPTLFGNNSKKTDVALMVLVNSVTFDDGFDLSAKLIQIYNLSAINVLSASGKELVSLNQNQHIPHFLTCVKCCFKSVKVDEVILECISALTKKGGEVEDLIKMLNSDSNKINAYLMCGKLKSAYLLAIKLNSALDLRRIMLAAEQSGQDSVQQFCKRWLELNAKKIKHPSSPSRE